MLGGTSRGTFRVSEIMADERGGLTTIFAVCLLALAMTTGIALIAADVNWTHTETLGALDAAVLAGASAKSGTTDEQRIAIAERTYAANQAIQSANGNTLTIATNGPAVFSTTETLVVGRASIERHSPFDGLFGKDHLTVQVDSAAAKRIGTPVCVLGLDPTEEATIDFNGHASMLANNCAALANSDNSTGIRQVGQPSMTAKDIGVAGDFSGSNYSPKPTKDANPLPDPLASLPEPAMGPCNPMSGAKVTNDTITLQPGTYCGGITVLNSNVSLAPGNYIMKDGPLDIQAGSIVTGDQVMIAFLGKDSTLYLIGNASLSVTSPTNGTYKNIQFFGDRNTYDHPGPGEDNLWFTVIGNSTLHYDGVMYLPTFNAWFAGGSIVTGTSPNYLAIAKKLWFQDHTQVTFTQENSRGLDVVESGYLEHDARLIQ